METPDGKFWVYILENAIGRFYVGQTENLLRRVAEHQESDCHLEKFTHKHGPWKLVWSEPHPDRASAMRREKQIKSMKSAVWIRQNLLMVESQRVGINRDVEG